MRWGLVLLLFAVFFAFSFLVSGLPIPGLDGFVDNLAGQGFGILVGIVIGAFGVLMGTVTSLFSLIIDAIGKTSRAAAADSINVLGNLDALIREIRSNTLFMVASLAICSTIPVLRKLQVDSPMFPWLSMDRLVTTLVLWVILLSLIALFDIIGSMFKIYSVYSAIAKERLRQISSEEPEEKK